jgi:3-oxoacyl-[acyl-carrier protein] reductase
MGDPSILFNNAGLTMGKSRAKEISGINIEEIEQACRANCGLTFLLTQLCIPTVDKKGWGRVIFCSCCYGLY